MPTCGAATASVWTDLSGQWRTAALPARSPDGVPIEEVLTERAVPAGGTRRVRPRPEAGRGGVGIGVERGLGVSRITGPPAHGDLLGGHRVAPDEIVRGRLRRPAGRGRSRPP